MYRGDDHRVGAPHRAPMPSPEANNMGMRRGVLALALLGGCLATAKRASWSLSPAYDWGRTYTVALITPEGEALDRVAADQLTIHLLKVGNLRVAERENLEGLLAEAELGAVGVVDPQSAAQLGRMIGADLIGIVNISGSTLMIKLVDSETGEVLYMGEGNGPTLEAAAERALEGLLAGPGK